MIRGCCSGRRRTSRGLSVTTIPRRAEARHRIRRARAAPRVVCPTTRRRDRSERHAPRVRQPDPASAQNPTWRRVPFSTRSGCAQKAPSIQSGLSLGMGTGSTVTRPPSHPASTSGCGKISISSSATSGRKSAMSHIVLLTRASYVKRTTGPRATRRNSRTPCSRSSSQWWMDRMAIAASTDPSRSGNSKAMARIAGATVSDGASATP